MNKATCRFQLNLLLPEWEYFHMDSWVCNYKATNQIFFLMLSICNQFGSFGARSFKKEQSLYDPPTTTTLHNNDYYSNQVFVGMAESLSAWCGQRASDRKLNHEWVCMHLLHLSVKRLRADKTSKKNHKKDCSDNTTGLFIWLVTLCTGDSVDLGCNL